MAQSMPRNINALVLLLSLISCGLPSFAQTSSEDTLLLQEALLGLEKGKCDLAEQALDEVSPGARFTPMALALAADIYECRGKYEDALLEIERYEDKAGVNPELQEKAVRLRFRLREVKVCEETCNGRYRACARTTDECARQFEACDSEVRDDWHRCVYRQDRDRKICRRARDSSDAKCSSQMRSCYRSVNECNDNLEQSRNSCISGCRQPAR